MKPPLEWTLGGLILSNRGQDASERLQQLFVFIISARELDTVEIVVSDPKYKLGFTIDAPTLGFR